MSVALRIPWRYRAGRTGPRPALLVATCLRLSDWRAFPAFVRHSSAVIEEMRGLPGFVGYALKTYPFRREFLTLSGWESESAMRDFVRCQAHRAAMRWQGSGGHRLTSAHLPGSDIDWAAAERALAENDVRESP
jgi:heme-degrading monooxygenase HmoA